MSKAPRPKTEPLPSEYNSFEDLTKKLLTVPKKKLDEARTAERAAKKPA